MMFETPGVTCLCPTYGRLERLRDAVACFLLQDYPNRWLLILNDAPVPISFRPPLAGVAVVNAAPRYETLGHKRQALLWAAQTPLAAHWDDDDLYLPWHLSHCAAALSGDTGGPRAKADQTSDKGPQPLAPSLPQMVKPRGAWWAVGPGAQFHVKGPCHNNFEGQLVFDCEAARELGGYPPTVSGQALALMSKFQKAEIFHRFDPFPFVSYVYRWGDGVWHISGGGDNERNHASFARRSTDFGDGEPLIPKGHDPLEWAAARLEPLFDRLLEGVHQCISTDVYPLFETRLKHYFKVAPARPGEGCP